MPDDASVVQQFRDHRVIFTASTVLKEATSPQYAERLGDEQAWYRFVQAHGFSNVAKVVRWSPFELERVAGVPLHHLTGLTAADQQRIFSELLGTTARLHSLEDRPAHSRDLQAVYATGPLHCTDRVAHALGSAWPHPRTVNGRGVDALDFARVRERVRTIAASIRPPSRFVPVHGDLSFSNVLWDRSRRRIVLLSPRGRFGTSPVFGDALLDWAHLFFSVQENADALVEGSFRSDRDANDARVTLGSAGWERCAGELRSVVPDRWEDVRRLQPLLWLTLAGSATRRPTQLEAAYLRALELLAQLDE